MAFFDPRSPRFYDPAEIRAEVLRVFDICHGCRLCFNLCPSFPQLFKDIDAQEGFGDVARLSTPQIDRVVDLCYQCKLCFEKCPYTPPHSFDLDFPRLMLRAKAQRAKDHGVTFQDRLLGDPDRAGKLGSWTAPVSNWANRNGLHRALLERVAGIDRRRRLPMFERETFAAWFRSRRRPAAATAEKAAIFSTCFVNYNGTRVGKSLVRVLERNGIEVSLPEGQRCCGMPAMDGGDMATAMAWADRNLELLAAAVAEGNDIVVPGPTCSYVLKHDYPEICADKPAAAAVAKRVFDSCEYLMKRHAAGTLDRSFDWSPGKIAYHLPCHLKVQNIGYRSRDLLRLIPGAEVTLLDRCTGMDGTWGMKKDFFDLSLAVAEPLFREVRETAPDLVASDCPLAAIQIEHGTGHPPQHPIEVLDRAYHGGRAADDEE